MLEEVARSWKNRNGGVIVEGTNKELQDILKTLEGNMSGGKVVAPGRSLPRGDSMLDVQHDDAFNTRLGIRPTMLTREESNASFGMSGLGVDEDVEEEEATSLSDLPSTSSAGNEKSGSSGDIIKNKVGVFQLFVFLKNVTLPLFFEFKI